MSVLSNLDSRRLDQRVTFQRKIETQNSDSGAIDVTWANIGTDPTVWAGVDAVLANQRNFEEPYVGGQELSASKMTMWIRWRGDITTNMRILWNNQVFDIVGIPNNQRRGRFLSLFVATGVNEG